MTISAVGKRVARHAPEVEDSRKDEVSRTKGTKSASRPGVADPERLYPPDRKGQFGAFAVSGDTSMDAQYQSAIKEAQDQARAMRGVAQATAAAHRATPELSRFSEVSVGVGSAVNTVPNLAGGVAESAIRGNSKPLAAAADDAQSAVGFVFGEQTDRISQAKGLYRQFEQQYLAYHQASQQYQAALRDRDHAAIPALKAKTEQLAVSVKQTTAALGNAVKRAAEGDKQFEEAAVQAAIHLAMSAASVGKIVGGPAVVGAHAVKDMAVEVGAVQGGERLLHEVLH